MAKRKLRVLGIFSHCDDEIIFGWPMYFNEDWKRDIAIVSDDEVNPDRQQYKEGRSVMFRLARDNDVDAVALPYPSEFYRLETRKGGLARFCDSVKRLLDDDDYDAVFTHNPHGEYGHMDHKLVFDIVFNHSKHPIMFTDICQESNWPSDPAISGLSRMLFYKEKVGEFEADEAKLKAAEAAYRIKGCWTWDKPIQKTCSVYKLG